MLFGRLHRAAGRFSLGRCFLCLEPRANKLRAISARWPRLRCSLFSGRARFRIPDSFFFSFDFFPLHLPVCLPACREGGRWGRIGRASEKRNGADMSRKRPRDWGIAVAGARRAACEGLRSRPRWRRKGGGWRRSLRPPAEARRSPIGRCRQQRASPICKRQQVLPWRPGHDALLFAGNCLMPRQAASCFRDRKCWLETAAVRGKP